MEYARRGESRLDVRRLRDLRPSADGRRSSASVARAGAVRADPDLRRRRHRPHAARLGNRGRDRRHSGRLHRTQADHGDLDPGLLAHDRTERLCVGLGVVRCASPARWHCHRLRVGYRCVDHGRALAGQGARQGRRADAVRPGDRVLPRVAGMALRRHIRGQWMALHVSARHPARILHAVDTARDPGIAALGAGQPAPPRRA